MEDNIMSKKKEEPEDTLEREPFCILLLRRDYPEFEIPTPCVLSEDHVIPALNLLIDRFQGKSGRTGKISTLIRPEIGDFSLTVTSSHDGDSGGYSSRSDEIPITEDLLNALRKKGYVQGKPERGYTSASRFIVTKHGEEFLLDWHRKRREQREEAEREENHVVLTELYDGLPRPIT